MVALREYKDRDLQQVVQLWHRTWCETFPNMTHPDSYGRWLKRFADEIVPQSVIWVAETNQKIVGFVVIQDKKHYLDQIFVEPAFQRCGIGQILLAKAKEISPNGLSLHTLSENQRACQFYESNGFVRDQEGVNRVNGHPNVAYHWRSSNHDLAA